MAKQLSMKRLAIDKANFAVVIAVSVAVFISVFSLVATKSLIEQSRYQAKVIDKKKIALVQLKKNVEEVNTLETSYKSFVLNPENILGGSPTGNGERDGDNARIVLDALPSKYDFPALTASLAKLLNEHKIDGISGLDEEVLHGEKANSSTPEPVEMPFTVNTDSSPDSVKSILELYERSIRPIKITKLTLLSVNGNVKSTVEAKTYFQPSKTFNVRTETLK